MRSQVQVLSPRPLIYKGVFYALFSYLTFSPMSMRIRSQSRLKAAQSVLLLCRSAQQCFRHIKLYINGCFESSRLPTAFFILSFASPPYPPIELPKSSPRLIKQYASLSPLSKTKDHPLRIFAETGDFRLYYIIIILCRRAGRNRDVLRRTHMRDALSFRPKK